MSWLSRSLSNSMATPDPKNNDDQPLLPPPPPPEKDRTGPETSSSSRGAGVKEDLTELTETLSRQFWGVASFLAPQPPPPPPPPPPPLRPSTVGSGVNLDADTAGAGIRGDFAEIGGRFRSGIGRIASNFLPPFRSEEGEEEFLEEEDEEEEGEEVVGVTEEVMTYARNIAMHPETWLDFPLFAEFEDTSDFEMSNAQQEHAFAVESLLPRLAALRIELCPTHMTEGCFWKIYFVLLHSRLNKHDAELLSTPQIVEARAMLLQKLQNRNKQESETYNRGLSYRSVDFTSVSPREHVRSPSNLFLETSRSKADQSEADLTSLIPGDLETERHAVNTTEVRIIEQSEHAVQQRENRWEMPIQKYEEDDDDVDDWFEDEAEEGACFGIPLGNQEDVSFSDLEEDDDPRAPVNSKESSSRVVPLKTSTWR